MSAPPSVMPTVGDVEEDKLFGISYWPAIYLIIFAAIFFIGGLICIAICCMAAKKRQRRRQARSGGRGVEPLPFGGSRESFMVANKDPDASSPSRVSKVYNSITREDGSGGVASTRREHDRTRNKLLSRDFSDSSSNVHHRYSDDDEADDWRYGEGESLQPSIAALTAQKMPLTQRGLYSSPSATGRRGDGPGVYPAVSSPRGTQLGMWDRGRMALGEEERYQDDVDVHVHDHDPDQNLFTMHTTLATKENITQVFAKIWDTNDSDMDNENSNDDDALLGSRERDRATTPIMKKTTNRTSSRPVQ